VAQAISLERTPEQVHQASVAAIAAETETSVDIVKTLYQEQVVTLESQAKVKQFIGVIATKRVKQQLRELGNTEA
jgi:hypothetical protein